MLAPEGIGYKREVISPDGVAARMGLDPHSTLPHLQAELEVR